MSAAHVVRLAVPASIFALLVAAPSPRSTVQGGQAPAPLVAAGTQGAVDVPLEELYHELGAAEARVVVVAFSDFGCPYCGRFERETFPALRAEFIDTGRVRWRFLPFVLGMFPNGAEAMQAAGCVAEQGDAPFWRMHDVLFARTEQWKAARDPDALYRAFAAEAGADPERFRACYDGMRAGEREAAAHALAARMGVRSTPTFFVNGVMVQGALPLEQFRTVLEDAGA